MCTFGARRGAREGRVTSDGVAPAASPRLAELPLHERAQLLAELRSSQGFMAEAKCTPDRVVVREYHCAIREVAERFPEICRAEQEFVERMLGVPVQRTCHMLTGCSSCAYTVRHPTSGQEHT